MSHVVVCLWLKVCSFVLRHAAAHSTLSSSSACCCPVEQMTVLLQEVRQGLVGVYFFILTTERSSQRPRRKQPLVCFLWRPSHRSLKITQTHKIKSQSGYKHHWYQHIIILYVQHLRNWSSCALLCHCIWFIYGSDKILYKTKSTCMNTKWKYLMYSTHFCDVTNGEGNVCSLLMTLRLMCVLRVCT